jgi:L-demethylnoviosyl transferase
MRVLFTTAAMRGHFYPVVPTLWSLRNGGHQVLAASSDDFVPAITGAGLSAVSLGKPADPASIWTRDSSGRKVPPLRSRQEEADRSGRVWGRFAAHALEPTLAAAERWRPDLIISEPSEYAGRMVAGKLGIPWAEHSWGLPLRDGYTRFAELELGPRLEGLGLLGFPAPALLVDVCPPGFSPPDRGIDPATEVVRVRYTPFNGVGALPDWLGTHRRARRVYVTFGSLLPQLKIDRLGACLRAAAGTLPDADILVGVDPELLPKLQPLPANVLAAGWIPLDLVLSECDLIVHHGGPGTTLSALVSGVPQVVAPQWTADLIAYAARVSKAGIGRHLEREDDAASALAEACRAVLDDPAYLRRARIVAKQAAAQPSPDIAAAALERLVRGT